MLSTMQIFAVAIAIGGVTGHPNYAGNAQAQGGCPFLKRAAVSPSAVFDRVHHNDSASIIGDPGSSCPFRGTRVEGLTGTGPTLEDWYPNRLRVEILGHPSPRSNPYENEFNYTEAFSKLDLDQVKQDLRDWMTDSQSWWPADYGNYGPQMVRTTWHNAGTYRIADGRGGVHEALQRFLPISSWIDNANTDKTRRLLWPIKQKYGASLSWGDLIVLAGNIALENMGVKLVGYGGGRVDAWEDDTDTYWGSELTMLGRNLRWKGAFNESYFDLANPLANTEQALIYVNAEGPGGIPDPLGSAREIRESFRRMAMDDEETVALIAGGHSFGKSHGAVSMDHVGPPPENTSIEYQGLGWVNDAGTGNANYTVTNGIEGSWTEHPTVWNKEYLQNLVELNWTVTESPAGSKQWRPVHWGSNQTTPDAHIANKSSPVMMMTVDIALREDPSFGKIIQKFYNSPEEVFFDAFSRAWFKLTHRDLGPKTRYLGPDVPEEDFVWQDPIPAANHTLVNSTDISFLKATILNSTGLDPLAFARAAWASASTHRVTDRRGGANGARIRLAPQNNWEVNRPDELSKVLASLERVQNTFNARQKGNKRISLADLIVLGGCAAVEQAAHKAGVNATVPFTPGRTDASLNQTDVGSFEWLHPVMDGFRNFETGRFQLPPESFMIERAKMLGLTAPQLTVLLGGMRSLNMNWDDSPNGVFTDRPGTLTNDYFVNLLNMSTSWKPLDDRKTRFEGVDRTTGAHRWYATRVDLIFGANNQLRATSEVYGSSGSLNKFVNDFISAWDYVMMLDRYDVKHQ